MRTEHLTYFLEVAKRHSMTLASEKLHMSQQTLSGIIKNLEEELGILLFNRHYSGVTLTEEGQAFVASSKKILYELDTFKRNYTNTKSTLSGMIHLYATPALSGSVLGDILSKFIDKYPLIKFQTYENDLASIYRAFEQENLPPNSIALINLPDESHLNDQDKSFSPPKHTTFFPLVQEHFIACVSKQSPLATKSAISIKTLLQQPLILHLTDQLEDSTIYYLLQQNGTPNIALTTSNSYVYLQAIENNIGVGVLPNLSLSNPMVKNNTDNFHILAVKNNPLQSIIGYLLPVEKASSPLLECFKTFLNTYGI